LRCLLCGDPIGKEVPVPIARIEFTPVVPFILGITPNRLGSTVLTDRICCQNCYKKVKVNDQLIIEEVELQHAKQH
jgi:hypothetical protein